MVKVIPPFKYKLLNQKIKTDSDKIRSLALDFFGPDRLYDSCDFTPEFKIDESRNYDGEHIGHLLLKVFPKQNEIYAYSCEKKDKNKINNFAKGIEKITGKEVTIYYRHIDDFKI
ncbi:hypothetical protein M0R19_02895 [Candidatus Pacearchaeota archaeon]|nr:hypothetical protein [Candidatus Pacearchaeota archaeon]